MYPFTVHTPIRKRNKAEGIAQYVLAAEQM